MTLRVSVIVPAYNEEATILQILREIRKQSVDGVQFEVIVVDDGSRDRTAALLEAQPNLYNKMIKRPTNGGKGAAVLAGLRAAGGDYILFQDADLEYSPSHYAALLFPVQNLGAQVVIGSRFLASRYTRVQFYWHRLGNSVITKIFNALFNTTFTDIFTCYLLYRRDLLDPDELVSTGWEQHAEILCRIVPRAKVIYEVPVSYQGRTYEEGKKILARHAIPVILTVIRRRTSSALSWGGRSRNTAVASAASAGSSPKPDRDVTGSDASVPKPAPSNLALRWISSLVLAPLVVAITWYGGWPFVALCTIAACIVLWEWSMLVGSPSALAVRPLEWFVGWMIAGLVYAGALLLAPIVLRGDATLGFVAIIFLLAIVWSTDVFAYFAGRALGGPKLMPAVSPKKTWSGAAGGTLGALAAGLIVVTAAGLPVTAALAAVALLLSIVSQLGDLLESAIKRRFNAKDASQLIPGHGGLMDRLDGFLTAALAAAMVGLLRGGLEAPARGLLIW